MLGAIAIQSLRTADLSPLCLADPACLTLAALHSDAVDFPKTGRPVEWAQLPKTRFKLKPDWYATETNEKKTGFYESKRIIGQLFRAITLPAIPEAQRVAKRQRRQFDADRNEDFQAEEVRKVFANDEHIISGLVYNRLRNYVSIEDLNEGDEDWIDEMLESSGHYAGDLAYFCRTHSLSTKTPISEEEIVAGTILAKCSQAVSTSRLLV
jgi:RNA-dependent RNA polymerase